MVCAIALDDVLAPFKRIRMMLIVTGLVSMVAAAITGVFLSKGLSVPILQLVEGTAKVARGDYDFRINIASRDELGILANAFNSMVRGVFLKEKMDGTSRGREIQMSSLPKQMRHLPAMIRGLVRTADEAGGTLTL